MMMQKLGRMFAGRLFARSYCSSSAAKVPAPPTPPQVSAPSTPPRVSREEGIEFYSALFYLGLGCAFTYGIDMGGCRTYRARLAAVDEGHRDRTSYITVDKSKRLGTMMRCFRI